MATNKAFIVTGGGSGIGRAAALMLARRGGGVLSVDLRFDDALHADVAGELVEHVADVSSCGDVESAVRAALDHFGQLDGIFNNAGIEGPVLPIHEYGESDFDRVFAVNVKGQWLMIKHALEALEQTHGAIVSTASTAGLMGWPRLAPYVASKHAVVGLTRALAMELATRGVRVNAISPGPTDTRMLRTIGEATAPGNPAKAVTLQILNVPVGRLARPQEIAELACWLLLDAPAFLTGAVIPIDGGQTSGYGEVEPDLLGGRKDGNEA